VNAVVGIDVGGTFTDLFQPGIEGGRPRVGPMIVEQPDTTVVIDPDMDVTVDPSSNLIVRRR
jgi:N-methylhydantoinase A/oxoprolinase/acetone carboxylase beta subunit